MKIFDSNNSTWEEKVNFVDDNNVLLGYDTFQSCCENADWFISETRITNSNNFPSKDHKFDLEPYFFDITSLEDNVKITDDDWEDDSSGLLIVKLKAKGKPTLFLHLYNLHNGYYGHGWELLKNNKQINSGGL